MTDKEKAKAYDEAVKKAQCWLNDPQTIQDCNYTIEDAIQNIFPVLAKNEDEMIRKELINWINGKTTYEWSYEWCENKDRWIAYLEKQKNLDKMIVVSPEVWDTAISDAYENGRKDGEKQKEQKPAEWNPNNEDVTLFNKAVTTNPNLTPSERAKLDIIRMKFKRCNGNTANPAEWSEEDRKMLDDCIMALSNWRDAVANYGHEVVPCQKLIDWLKSLRPQPHSEWRHYIWATNLRFDFTALIKYDNTDNYEIVQEGNRPKQEKNGVYILIKDIKPQPSWKPSEEQMIALRQVISGCSYDIEPLVEIEEHLKKLM